MATKNSKLNARQRIGIYETMKPLLKPAKTEGMWNYIDGYDDKRVAAIVGTSVMRIVGVRNTFFGKLEPEVDAVPYVRLPDIIRRLMVVEKELADLKANLGG